MLATTLRNKTSLAPVLHSNLVHIITVGCYHTTLRNAIRVNNHILLGEQAQTVRPPQPHKLLHTVQSPLITNPSNDVKRSQSVTSTSFSSKSGVLCLCHISLITTQFLFVTSQSVSGLDDSHVTSHFSSTDTKVTIIPLSFQYCIIYYHLLVSLNETWSLIVLLSSRPVNQFPVVKLDFRFFLLHFFGGRGQVGGSGSVSVASRTVN